MKRNLFINLLFVFVFLFFCACNVTMYKHKRIYFLCEKNIILDITIPKYACYKIYHDLDCAKSICFYYPDSMLIYFVGGVNSLNANNIKCIGDSIYKFRCEYGELFKKINLQKGDMLYSPELPDTFELSGINKKGLYWKDIYFNGISIGYDNVPLNQKELFDNCLKGIKIKERHTNRIK